MQVAVAAALLFVTADAVYRYVQNISYLDKSKCILNRFLPRFGFLLFENFVELIILVFLGVFAAALLEKYFLRFRRFYPSNVLTAFLYGAILPGCACAAIPVVRTLQDKMNMRSIVTFIVAAPLLDPYVITLSFTVLGPVYGALRIASSFVLAVSAGYVLEYFYNNDPITAENLRTCNASSCSVHETDVFLKTWAIFRSVLPYVLAGGAISVAFEMLLPKSSTLTSLVDNTLLGNLAVILVGVPLYFCNGSDVLLLRPLVCSGISVGTAIAFSLTSTAVCITSMLMLVKFMGKRLTAILIAHIVIVTLALARLIHLFA